MMQPSAAALFSPPFTVRRIGAGQGLLNQPLLI